MFDVVIIGAGPGGYRAAELAGDNGLKVLLIEENNLGGVCLNEGCIPFKNYLYASGVMSKAKHLSSNHILDGTQNFTLNQRSLVNQKRKLMKALRQSVANSLKASGVETITGHAFINECGDTSVKVIVGNQIAEGRTLIIATGSREKGFIECGKNRTYRIIDSRSMLDMVNMPRSIEIIGGGAVGLETASFFSDAGCEVTIIEGSGHIGGTIDIEISEALKAILEKKGVKIRLNSKLLGFESDGVAIASGGETFVDAVDCVMLATGRIPNTSGFGLENTNITYDKTGIKVNEKCQTSNPLVYACGDVTGELMLAHTAYKQAETAVNAILGRDSKIDYRVIPRVIYTNPEVLSIGPTEEECILKSIPYVSHTLPMTYSGKYYAEYGKDGSKAKLMISRTSKEVIGFHMLGNGASEISLAIEMMIMNKMTVNQVRSLVFAHPTVGEVIYELAGCLTQSRNSRQRTF